MAGDGALDGLSGAAAEAADRLYGLPLEEFTPARDGLAKRLRADGDRPAADAVKGLRKPTRAAWAVNQAIRSQPHARASLLDAAARLRAVQRDMAAGRTGAGELRAAADAERAAVNELVEAARGLCSDNGRFLGEGTLDRVRASLHAVALDDDARDEVTAGRLTRDRQAVGLGLLAGPEAAATGGGPATPAPAPARKAGAARSRPPRERTDTKERLRAAERARREVAVRARAADRSLREAERAARDLERRLESARQAAEGLAGELAAAERGLAAAQREREEAQAALAEADTRVAALRGGD